MSLLIDALKQAEAARAQAQSGESPDATAGGIELEPLAERQISTPPSAASSRQGIAPTPAQEARRARPAASTSSVIAADEARGLFQVKRQAPNRLPLILAGIGICLFLIGAGYVWWAIQPRSGLMTPGLRAAEVSNQTARALPAVPAAASVAADMSAGLLPATPGVVSQTVATASPADVIPPRRERREAFRAAPERSQRVADTPASDTKQQIRSGAPTATDIGGVQAGYAAYLEGNYSLARQRYQDVLRQDPRNVDAMNALGLIAWRSGQPDVAERMFRAAVQADPKDATAMSQLALLYAEGDAAAAEGRLRNLIASQPNAGAAYYALGTVLARQERWNEAQQALFQAYTLDSDNPDVLFNLAVSLEHLSQAGAARQFYERALQAAARRPAGFDKSVAQGRVLALGSR